MMLATIRICFSGTDLLIAVVAIALLTALWGTFCAYFWWRTR